MRVLLPTERSSCTQRRTPRHIESFWGSLASKWVAAWKEDDREKRSGRTSPKSPLPSPVATRQNEQERSTIELSSILREIIALLSARGKTCRVWLWRQLER